MRRVVAVVTIVAPLVVITGCRSQQLGYDQHQFRQVLLAMYEDQLMDNLVRAKNRQPLLQLDYTNITGTVTHSGTANLSGGPVGSRTTTFVKPTTMTAGGSLVRFASQALTYTFNASQINQLTVTANPIVDNSALYLAYVSFVERPGRLVESCDPPPQGAAHVVRQYGKQFYWVPEEFRNEYMELALRTNGARSDPSDAAAYYEATVIGARDFVPESAVARDGQAVTFLVDITGVLPKDDGIPNDDGWLTAVVDGRQWRFRIVETFAKDLPKNVQSQYSDKKGSKDDKDKYGNGTLTRTLKVRFIFDPTVNSIHDKPDKDHLQYAPFQPRELAQALASRVVRIELDHYKPAAPTFEDTLGSIRTQTELLRLNQLQLLKP